MSDALSSRTAEEMKPVLLNPEAPAPEVFYHMNRGGKDAGNITTIFSGVVGDEYIKTLGHYHVYDFTETYTVVEGDGLMLLQKRKVDAEGNTIDDEIEEFRVVRLSVGDSLTLPLRFGHVLVNIGTTPLVTRDDSPSDAASSAVRPHADYEPIKNLHGLAYYCISKDGAPALVKNSNYKVVENMDAAGLPVHEQ